ARSLDPGEHRVTLTPAGLLYIALTKCGMRAIWKFPRKSRKRLAMINGQARYRRTMVARPVRTERTPRPRIVNMMAPIATLGARYVQATARKRQSVAWS